MPKFNQVEVAVRHIAGRCVPLLGLSLLLFGCGALTSGPLKGLVVQRCELANLNGCEDIATGIFELADGKASAMVAIKRGAARNDPEALKAFTANVMCARDMMSVIPGANDSLKPIFDAVELLQPTDDAVSGAHPAGDGKSLVFAVDCRNGSGAGGPCSVQLASDGDDSVSLSLLVSGHAAPSVTLSARDVQRIAQVLVAAKPELKTARHGM